MASVPLKPQYGPTLGELLEPRWRASARSVRVAVVALGICLVGVAVGVVLALLDASYSHSGKVPFSFKYRGLYRTAPDPGGYVKVVRYSGGRLADSYAVAPLRLGSYDGSVTAELPLLAAGYTDRLARRFDGFRLEQEGKTRISSTLGGYDIRYSAIADGRKIYGRDVMLLPTRPKVREGVVVEMLSDESASGSKPVASRGVLEKPLKTFTFG